MAIIVDDPAQFESQRRQWNNRLVTLIQDKVAAMASVDDAERLINEHSDNIPVRAEQNNARIINDTVQAWAVQQRNKS